MRAAVVGGGLSGWCAAHELSGRGHDVRVFEAGPRFGGQVHTRTEHGFVVELGAEGFVARSPAVRDLCRGLGLEDELEDQVETRALAWRNGALEVLRPGEGARLLGIAADPDDLGRGLATLRTGMGALIDALIARSPDVRAAVGARVERIERRGAGWAVVAPDGEWLADAAILAVPPAEAARLAGHDGDDDVAARRSLVAVSLSYRREHVSHPLDASGLVVPGAARGALRACTFSSSKFPGRAPAGWCLLRAFFDLAGGDRSDAAWRAAAHEALGPLLGLAGPPARAWVARWPDALPRERAAPGGLTERIRLAGRLEPAWVGIDGHGIDGAVRAGIGAARRLDGTQVHSVA